jgi:hypothetical protein
MILVEILVLALGGITSLACVIVDLPLVYFGYCCEKYQESFDI